MTLRKFAYLMRGKHELICTHYLESTLFVHFYLSIINFMYPLKNNDRYEYVITISYLFMYSLMS